jgi:hypothetical protein
MEKFDPLQKFKFDNDNGDAYLNQLKDFLIPYSNLHNFFYLVPKEHIDMKINKDVIKNQLHDCLTFSSSLLNIINMYIPDYDYDLPEVQEFIIPARQALISGFILREFLNTKIENTITPILFPNVSGEHLRPIIRYMKHQNGIPGQIPTTPLHYRQMRLILNDEWVANFCEEFTPDLIPDFILKTKFDSYTKEEKDLIPKQREYFWKVISTSCCELEIVCLTFILCAKSSTIIKGIPPNKIKGIISGTYEIN